MQISEIAIRRPILTLMSIGSLIVFGLVAQQTIGLALYPDVDMPMVSVSVVYEGASPKTVETEVTEVLEEALSTISGIKSMRSDTSEGVAQVFLEFDLERDVDIAAQDVRDKLSAVQSELPIDAEAPVVDKFDPDAAPILGIVLSGPSSIRDLTLLADDTIKPQIESINGVGGVRVTGGREREIRVWLRLDDLKARSLSAQDVIDALKKENVEFPGGRIEAGARELVVKTRGRVPQVADFKDLIVARRQQSVVRLHEVAVIEDGMEDQRSMARLNGVAAVSMSVRQQSGTNMVAVADVVKAKLDQIRVILPEGHNLLVIQDLSTFVQSSVDEAQGELLRGGTLAVMVILLFLRSLRGAFVSAVTIPATIVSTYAFMLAMGFTLNMMTLLALTISVGMIIDDSIVVLENTYRHMQAGLSRMQAAVAAMNEIGFAVIVTSLSIAAVFVPVAFMDGLVGQFFYEFGMTVTFAVVVSTIIAVSLSPMLCARLLVLPKTDVGRIEPTRSMPERRLPVDTQSSFNGGPSENRVGAAPAHATALIRPARIRRIAHALNPGRAIEAFLNWTERFYGRLLHLALSNRVIVLASAVGLFVASGFLLPLIGQEFTPSEDEGQFSVQVEAPVGSSIHRTDRIAAAVEERMGRLPFIKDIYTTIGGQYEGMVTVADVMVKLAEKEDRTLSQTELMAMAREQLSDLSHLRLSVNAVNRTGGGGGMRTAPIQYNLRGDSMEELTAFADTIVSRLRATPGFVDVNTTSQTGKPEVSVTIDRDRASDLGVKVEDVGKAVSALIGGQKVTTFEDDGKSIDVRLRLVGSDREKARAIQALPLRRLDGQLTELRNLATVDMTLGPVTIERQSRKRQVTVLANLEATKPLGEGVEDVKKLESELHLPDGVVSIFTGSADMMAESFASILFCLFMAVVLTYMILAAQFESFLHPFTIMLSLPLSVGGALGGLFILGRTLNIFSMIGMVMLMGLVTKNAILLVDYTNLLRSRGVGKTEALLQAGPVRLRPILMTALSTIAGMIPVALGLGDGAASRAPMGACVVGGMITSTFLTLIVIPVVYSVVESGYDSVMRLFVPEGTQTTDAAPLLSTIDIGTFTTPETTSRAFDDSSRIAIDSLPVS